MLCKEIGIPEGKAAVTAEKYGNTAATAIPLAIEDAINNNQIEMGSGEEILLFGAASGFCIAHGD